MPDTKAKTYAVIGGDMRQVHLANCLAAREDGCKIFAMLLDKGGRLSKRITVSCDLKAVLSQSDVVLFPLPLLGADGEINAPLNSRCMVTLPECLAHIRPGALVLAGKVPSSVHSLAAEHGTVFIDYLEREEFAVANAVPTAEAAVEIALRELPITLFGATCLVTGYGRVAKVLARLLAAFGARVAVAARTPGALAWAAACGHRAVPFAQLADVLPQADVVFNTVPAQVLGEEQLVQLKRRCLLVDLASRPGGVDLEAAKALGLNAVWELSLPGKTAPVTAGAITLDTVCRILGEHGMQ